MAANREHKNSVFSLLFSDTEVLRELYGALEGIQLGPEVPIVINTLSDVLFKDQLNDLSFLVDTKLIFLFEHQSSINPNMPLRLLMYMSKIYEKIIERRKMYSSKPLKIPWPEFIVLYNGAAPYPDRQTLSLSDMFENVEHLKGAADLLPALELKVKVYNINQGHNQDMVDKCRQLKWYSLFIAKVRDFEAETGDLESAMRMAITYCVEHGILKEFLETNASEVLNMLITEWNTEEWGQVCREEGREEGRGIEKLETARKAFAKGLPIDLIRDITGLDTETLNRLSAK